MVFFSIITICYNSSATIERTIKSVLRQTYTDYEYIIVDGGSKDSTLDIIKKYEPLFEGRMKWRSEPDNGIYDAMNKGILRSSGEIIGIVNSDDWLEPNTLKILSDELHTDDVLKKSILTGEVLFHYSDGETQLFPTSADIYEYHSARYNMGLNHPATFVPRCIYDKLGLFDTNFKIKGDVDFILRCYENGIPVHFIHKVLSNMSDGGISNLATRKLLNDNVLKYRKHIKSPFKYRYYCIKSFVIWYIKKHIPDWYLRYYRRRHNKG